MSQHATIVGTVEYRLGDGPTCKIPKGAVEIDMSAADATLSWESGDSRQSAAMPKTDFQKYVASQAIRLH